MIRVSKCTLLCLVIALCACQTRELNVGSSYLTGWKSFDSKTTSFAVAEGYTSIPQGMLLIKGGTFTTGQTDEFVTAPHNYQPSRLSVSSFYMDKYEVTNIGWREYEHWTSYVFGRYNKALVKSVQPDTSVWRSSMAYNEPYEQSYYRHPAYSFYPVVGVSWDQAMAYCQWRTDRVNEMKLVNSGEMQALPYDLILTEYMSEEDIYYTLQNNYDHPEYAVYMPDTVQVLLSIAQTYGYAGEETLEEDEDGHMIDPLVTMYRLPYEWVRDQFAFNTEKYLSGANNYKPTFGKRPSLNSDGQPRKVNSSEGLLLVEGYRLPTEAEWEYAAFCPVTNADGIAEEGRIYPWSGYHPRNMQGKSKGNMMANFMLSKGDAGASTDGYVITAPVDAFAANDFGLYNMAGNVNEWVLDAYRDLSYGEMSEYSSSRGNVYARHKLDKNGQLIVSPSGCIEIEYVAEEELRGYKNSISQSTIDTDYPLDTIGLTEDQMLTYQVDPTDILAPHITDRARVYKGGSWSDRIYWLNPTSRRYMDKDQSSCTVGFRCAMTM